MYQGALFVRHPLQGHLDPEQAQQLWVWPPSALCCPCRDSATVCSKPLGPAKYPTKALSQFLNVFAFFFFPNSQTPWESGDRKNIPIDNFIHHGGWLLGTEASLRLRIFDVGDARCPHPVWWLHFSYLWTALSLAVQQYSFLPAYLTSTPRSRIIAKVPMDTAQASY